MPDLHAEKIKKNIAFLSGNTKLYENKSVQEYISNIILYSFDYEFTTDEETMMLLAALIHCEAQGESYEGQVAVGAVILNRVKSSEFPNTIAGVIYEPGAFTAVSDGQIDVPIDENSTVYKAAQDALNGWDPTNRMFILF